jgi:Mlc titration factor MtfA (ptsG expression regulator)
MNNIQDEIDLVGESAASIDAYAATDPASALPSSRNIFSARLNCSRPASRPVAAFLPLYRQDPLRVYVRMACRMKTIGALFTKTTC